MSEPAKLPPEGGVGGNTSNTSGWHHWLALLLFIKASASSHTREVLVLCSLHACSSSLTAHPDTHMAGGLPAEIGLPSSGGE